MTSVRGRGGRGVGGGQRGGAGGANGPDGANVRRGSWRGGPPGSNGSFSTPRGGSPAPGNASPVPRHSINDHMNVMGKVSDDKTRPGATKGFQTDTDISGTASPGAQRELQPWSADETSSPSTAASNGTRANGGATKDAETFGFGGPASNTPWDQFETNARLFGTTTSYQEELYTTKLNKSGPDFKQREKEAARLASEIMGQTAVNSHMAEERNQAEDAGKDEEEKYSGVQRNPNAYVPPAARRAAGMAPAARGTPTPPAASTPTGIKVNGTVPAAPAAVPPPVPTVNAATPTPTATAPPARSSSDMAPGTDNPPPEVKKPSASPQPKPATVVPPGTVVDEKDGQQLGTVLDQFRHFVGSEREKVEAKKQSMIKMDRERTMADFKKFQTSFKVPLPMPKDILPLLAKDEEKQKAIEAKAGVALETAKTRKTDSPSSSKTAVSAVGGKKIPMKIPEIPPFKPKQDGAARPAVVPDVPAPPPPTITVPESANNDIPLATSPTPSAASQTSTQLAAKLNPNANSFVFKPYQSAASLKPGESSTESPASKPAPTSTAGPSVPKNPFFREQPQMPKGINPRDDFNPWKHGQPVAAASSIQPQWPYTGRKYNSAFMGPPMHGMPMGFEEDPSSPHGGPPQLMPGMPPNFPPYGYRFQPGMPPHGMSGQLGGNPMFSPGPGFNPIQGGPMSSPGHMGGPPQPNGMPMHYFPNGMPQNPQFVPPQHMQYNPNTPQRQGPGGPGPGPGGPMYYSHQIPTPQQTPQQHHNALQPPSQPQFQTSPMQPPQIPGGSFDGGGGGAH